jgi:hypothetical protein
VDLVVGGFRESGSSVDRLRESSPHVDGFRVSCSSVDSVADIPFTLICMWKTLAWLHHFTTSGSMDP